MTIEQGHPQAEDSVRGDVLYVALELSLTTWKLGCSDGRSPRVRVVSIPAGDWGRWAAAVGTARRRFSLSVTGPVYSCYEAGREAFSVHRALVARGVVNVVVDAASIETSRRARRAKTDRLDAVKLVQQLVRAHRGERDRWREVRVPDEAAEDARHLHREITVLQRERQQHRVRIQSLLFTQGVRVTVGPRFAAQLPTLHQWDGRPLGPGLTGRIRRELGRLAAVEADLRALRREQRALVRTAQTRAVRQARQLMALRGLAIRSSWVFAHEVFGWRTYRNRREVGSAVGLTPLPYQSGARAQDQGISGVGNPRVRALAVEIAWSWRRFQPQSALSQWYEQRFGGGGPRSRKIGIIALARKLVIALWKYLTDGEVPAGARFKVA